MKLFKKFWANSLGLSMVELLAAVAILSLVAAGAAGAITVASTNYSKGSTDIALQQSAQVLTNFLTNLVVDAQAVEYSESGDDCELKITDSFGMVSTVSYTGGVLYLNGPKGSGVLADSLESFKVINRYDRNKSVGFKFTFKSGSGRSFKSSFTATSRNEVDTVIDGALILVDQPVVLLEPNQYIVINYLVYTMGTVTDATLQNVNTGYIPANSEGLTDTHSSRYEITPGQVIVYVGDKENRESFYVDLYTNAIDPETTAPYDHKRIMVKVRRVNNLITSSIITEAAGDVDETYPISVKLGDSTAVYNGDFNPLYEATSSYKSPYGVVFNEIKIFDESDNVISHYTVSGNSLYLVSGNDYLVGSISSKILDGTGAVASDFGNPAPDYEYIFNISVKSQIKYGSRVVFYFESNHSTGTNKTSKAYYDTTGSTLGVKGTWTIYVKKPTNLDDSRFQRGKYVQFDPSEVTKKELTEHYSNGCGNSGEFVMRVRVDNGDGTYGDWSTFISGIGQINDNGSNNGDSFIQDMTSYGFFEINKAYEFEVLWVVRNSAGNIVAPNYMPLRKAWATSGISYVGNEPQATIYSCGNRFTIGAVTLSNLSVTPCENKGVSVSFDNATSIWNTGAVLNNLVAKYPDGSTIGNVNDISDATENCCSTKLYNLREGTYTIGFYVKSGTRFDLYNLEAHQTGYINFQKPETWPEGFKQPAKDTLIGSATVTI